MGRSKLPDFDAERPPELTGLAIFSTVCATAPGLEWARYSVELAFGERSRSRLKLSCQPMVDADSNVMSTEALSAGILLPRGTVLRGGTWVLGEGRALKVLAADEDLLEVSVGSDASTEENPESTTARVARPDLALIKAAYHLGNRHVALQLAPGLLKLEYDYVLADMLVAMGLKVNRRFGPFEPEWGAYASGHHH